MTKVVVVFGEFVTEVLSDYSTAEEAVADGYPEEGSDGFMFVVDAPDDVVPCCYKYDSTKTGDDRFYGVELAENECYTPQGVRNYTKELNESASDIVQELTQGYYLATMMVAAGNTAYGWDEYMTDLVSLLQEVLPYTTAVVTEETALNVTVPDYKDYEYVAPAVLNVTVSPSSATVTITATPTSGTTVSASVTGSGSLTLDAGTYTVSCAVPSGYYSVSSQTITVSAGNTYSMSFTLSVSARVYAYQLDFGTADSSGCATVSYPQTVTIGGTAYSNACYGYTPASGTTLNSWATDYDSGTGLISGIVPGTLTNAGVFTQASSKTTTPAGSTSANAVTWFPTWWVMKTKSGNVVTCVFADAQITTDFKKYASNGGDGFYLADYMAYDSSNAYSYAASSTAATGSVSWADWNTAIQSKGDGWRMMTYMIWTYMQDLMVIMWKSVNLQSAFAYGYGSSGYYRPQVTTNAYGMAGTAGSSGSHMAFFWVTDLWYNMNQWCEAYMDSSYNLVWWDTAPSSYSDSGHSVSTGLSANAGGSTIYGVIGTTEGGNCPVSFSGTAGIPDYGYVYAGTVLRVGGYYSSTASNGGPFYESFDSSASDTHTYDGARTCMIPR